MPKKKTARPPRGVAAEAFSHMTAVLENIEQQNRATIEAVFAVERRLTERFEARFASIEIRLSALEVAVRMNSEDIRKNSEAIKKNSEDIKKNSADIQKNSEDIAALQREVRRLAGILGADRDVNAITALENRVAALEARFLVGPPPGH